MFGAGTFPTGASFQFLLENRVSHRPMSFTGGHSPFRIPIQAFANTAASVDTRKPANLYDILHVKETASPIEIKTAYRSLAKRYHPDAGAASSSESNGHEFMEIHKAYSTLSDPMSRAQYDISIGVGRRFVCKAGNQRGHTRKWETDQCW